MTSFRGRKIRRAFQPLLCVVAVLTAGHSGRAFDNPPPSSPAASPYAWKNVQIVGGGFVDGLQFHPAQKGLAYARTDVGGAYRWDDTARQWVAITDGFGFEQWNYTGIESLAIDPTDTKRLYAAVGTYTNDWAGKGAILRSGDQGRTWQVTAMPFKMGGNEGGRFAGERLAVDPSDPRVLYFGSRHDGLWRSVDRAATWSRVASFPIPVSGKGGMSGDAEGVGVVFVDFDAPAKSAKGTPTRTLFVGVSSRDGGLWRSDDAGATFAPVAGQPKGLLVNHGVRASDGSLYLSYGDNPGPNGMTTGAVWKWNPTNGAWTDITPQTVAQNGGHGFGYAGLALDAQHPGTLMVATMDRWNPVDTLFRSTDGGAHWTDLGPQSQRDASLSPWLTWGRPGPVSFGHWMGALAIDPFDAGHVIYGTGATIWATDNATAADHNLPTHWTVGAKGLEETVVNDLSCPPSGAPLLSAVYDIDGFRHADTSSSPPAGLYRPSHGNNGGIDFAEANPNIVARTFWGDKSKGAYSLDNGVTWVDFPAAPAVSGGGGKIAVSADGATFVWSPDHGEPLYSRDRGTTWTVCAGLSTNVRRVVSDRADAYRFYAFDGASGTVWASADGGAHFATTTSGLPKGDGDLRTVAGVGHAGDLWLATNGGLFHSTDDAAHFARVGAATGFRLALGKTALGHDYPALYLAGTVGGVDGLHRSIDKGMTWTHIDDPRHRFGGINALAADPRVYGRVYIGTSGRGIVEGNPAVAQTAKVGNKP